MSQEGSLGVGQIEGEWHVEIGLGSKKKLWQKKKIKCNGLDKNYILYTLFANV